ncbi:MAG: Ppx/GppA family phosphatase, partial [Desulfurobacteriaceae bacterium]
MRIATIDVGTNSTRLLVADVVNGEVKQLFKTGRVTRLGRGVKRSGRLSREGIDETLKALREFKNLLENYSPDRVVVVTTEAARLADNSEEFLSRVRELGFEIELLPERQEAELVFRANLLHFKPSGKAMTIDLGGGSTEIVFGDVSGIELLRSLKFGVVFLHESFLKSDPPERGELLSMESFIEEELKPIRESI